MTDVGVAGRTVLVTGATGASGRIVVRALLGAGARVVAVGSDDGRLGALEDELPGAIGEHADLTDGDDVLELAMRVHARVGDIDGIIHLVGGWRGGGGIPGQSDEDYRFLERSFTALRHVSRAFWDDLLASHAGRIAIVSSTTVAAPTAGGANYAAVKAASESWMRSLAHGFTTAGEGAGATAAAVTFRVRALAGLEDRLATSVVDLWQADAATLNGTVTELTA
ncbi:SDR family NAD(P)-dependent oxidoreductase [Agromyces albus]|uniref:SDR family NAD(P)-dependent oxidoreductase n=1 Tax=Agromyces albus TaxID=205332 RepID=A0A4Q2L124_9MICO|nr:SDR family NAD(P)-dependent oxidoreductase [Agromyces albus]RXZ71745.1 SDR family NAD(P)-dependent oxidoreductase [Agromyces albus]